MSTQKRTMGNNFSERFKIVFKKYAEMVEKMGSRPSESGLARFLEVSQTTLQRWKNYQLPDPESLKAIHDKLGFSYDWLITGEGEMFDQMSSLLAEKDAEIARLRTMLLGEGVGDKAAATAITARAAGQE